MSTSNADCTYKWTVVNGLFSNGATSIQGPYSQVGSVSVTWSNIPFQGGSSIPNGTLLLTVFNCPLPNGEPTSRTEDVLIKTLNGVTPGTISGNASILSGDVTNKTYSIPRLKFPGSGQNGGSTSLVYADSYQWLIPAGWQIGATISNGTTPISGQGYSVSIKPNACTGGIIKVRGYSSCGPGYYSNWSEKTVSRNLPSLSFTQAPPDNVRCAITTPITVTVASVPGAQSYTWTKPNGWSGSSTTNTITLTPNGLNAGTVSVRANLCATQTNPLSKTINLQLFDPQNPPVVNGSLQVCSSGTTYSLLNAPISTTATWTVSPSNLVSQSNGSGFSAIITKANASSSGVATITFNLTGPCGPLPPFTKQIQIGAVKGSETNMSATCGTGTLCYVCPGNTYVFTALPPLGHQPGYTYQWTKPTNWSIINQSSNTITLYVPQNNPDFFPSVRFSVNNGCGWSEYSGLTVAPNYSCGSGYYSYNIFPNPSSDYLTIEPVVGELFKNSESEIELEEFEVKLFNQMEELVLETRSNGEKVKISLERLKSGMYFVHIYHKNGVVREQIKIEK
ncbi:T9SS type A sorting domain-containing protein [Algoriphagus persicinus]|uniref:T9SS type A sorting domain-containing protein n=1 Tax=Algoriphagus persicinus TaxID=3108754 RepID=UPI002B3969A3|nr:T9SS type A sorting domain-containing protein [Algoriphagus sp. E1-3-M2]MEB2783797.1 T9SS type A sorting domain-containing protein [Algoriphagus sp. E1-3-M2]